MWSWCFRAYLFTAISICNLPSLSPRGGASLCFGCEWGPLLARKDFQGGGCSWPVGPPPEMNSGGEREWVRKPVSRKKASTNRRHRRCWIAQERRHRDITPCRPHELRDRHRRTTPHTSRMRPLVSIKSLNGYSFRRSKSCLEMRYLRTTSCKPSIAKDLRRSLTPSKHVSDAATPSTSALGSRLPIYGASADDHWA
jgi:hypothetical protein